MENKNKEKAEQSNITRNTSQQNLNPFKTRSETKSGDNSNINRSIFSKSKRV